MSEIELSSETLKYLEKIGFPGFSSPVFINDELGFGDIRLRFARTTLTNRALITELIFIKNDLMRKQALFNALKAELGNRELTGEEAELLEKERIK